MKARGSTAFKEGEQMAPKLKKIDSHLHVWASPGEVTCIMSYCLHFFLAYPEWKGNVIQDCHITHAKVGEGVLTTVDQYVMS